MFDFRRIVLALVVLAIAIPMVSAQEGNDNLPFNCRITSTPPLVRLEGVAELAGDILISCSGIVQNQGTTNGLPRDLRANVTVRADVPVTSRAVPGSTDVNGRILTDALLINSGNQGSCANPFACTQTEVLTPVPTNPIAVGQIGQGTRYLGGSTIWEFPMNIADRNHGYWTPQDALGATLEWDNVLLAPGSAVGKQWFMQLRITNVRVNAASFIGLADFAPAINAVVTINTQTGNVAATPDTVVIARPRPSFRVRSRPETRRNCDDPKQVTMELDIIELLPNAFKPAVDSEVNSGSVAGEQDNPNSAFFTESGLMLDNVWAPTGDATQGTQFNISVISPTTLDSGVFGVSVGAGEDEQTNSAMVTSAGTSLGSSTSGNNRIRNFRIEVTDFALEVDPFLTNIVTVPITASYDETLWGQSSLQVWYLPLSNAGTQSTVAFDAPVPRFVPSIKDADGFTVTRCRTLLLFPYVTNRDGFNTGIAISNTSRDDNPGPFATDGGASPQTGPCTLYTYGGNNGPANPVAQAPLESTVNVPPGGIYLMNLATGGVVKGPAGQDVGPIGATPGFQGYIIASCEFQYAHGYAFLVDTAVQKLAQGYLALIIPDRLGTGDLERPASPFNLPFTATISGSGEDTTVTINNGAVTGGEQLVH